MARTSIVSLLALTVACAPADQPIGPDGWPVGPAIEDLGPGPEATATLPRAPLVLTVDQAIPGDVSTVIVTGAGPGEIVDIARSTGGLGYGPCLGTLGGLCLDIVPPVALHASVTADGAGVATLVQAVPETVPIGLDVWLQPIVRRGATGFSWIKGAVVPITTADAPLVVSAMVEGDLVITEVMVDPMAVGDGLGEWFEVYNASGLDANLDGLRITNGTDVYVVSSTMFLGAGEVAVFGVTTDMGLNGGVAVDRAYGVLPLPNTYGELYLLNGGLVVDGVAWDDGTSFPLAAGASMQVSPGDDHLANDIGANWCSSIDAYGMGDLGTPGAINPDCVRAMKGLWTVRSTDDMVRVLDTTTLTFTDIGLLGVGFTYGDLAWSTATQTMYMVDGRAGDNLYTIDVETGAGTYVGSHGEDLFALAWDPTTGTLIGGEYNSPRTAFDVNVSTGFATALGTSSYQYDGLAWDSTRNRMVGLSNSEQFFEVDTVAGTTTLLYDGPNSLSNCDIAYDSLTDRYWVISHNGTVWSYDPDTFSRTTELTSQGTHNAFVAIR